MSTGEVSQFRFGPFEICPATGELRKGDIKLKLQPQPFRLLLLLVSRPGELVSREELQEAVWSDGTTVEFDHSLNFCIRQIRAALAEDAHEPRYIETLPKRGYRFMAPVTRTVVELDPKLEPLAAPALTSPDAQMPLAPRDPGNVSSRFPGARARVVAAFAILIVLVSAVSWRYYSGSRSTAILVRPFVNQNVSPENAWFVDAITTRLEGALAKVPRVKVARWFGAAPNASPTIAELSRSFHVDRVLEGSVNLTGGNLDVTMQLVDAGTERILWSHQYSRAAANLGQVQENVLDSLAKTLTRSVTEGDVPRTRRRPKDDETYNLFLDAERMASDAIDTSAEAAEKYKGVIQRAPDFAPAYAGLANALVTVPFRNQVPIMPKLIEAETTARKAIELDDTLAEAHTALAHSYWQEWRWKESEEEFQRALALDGNLAIAHRLYGMSLVSQGRGDEGIRETLRAVQLHPMSPLTNFSLARVYLAAGHFDEAITQARRTQELSRHHPEAYQVLVRAYTLKGLIPEANAALKEWEQHIPEAPMQTILRANLLARSGDVPKARALIREWLKHKAPGRRIPGGMAFALAATGDTSDAFDVINEDITRHVLGITWLKSTPELVPVRSDARFIAALARMNLQ